MGFVDVAQKHVGNSVQKDEKAYCEQYLAYKRQGRGIFKDRARGKAGYDRLKKRHNKAFYERDAEAYPTVKTGDGHHKIEGLHYDDDPGIACYSHGGKEENHKDDGEAGIGNIHPHGVDLLANTLEYLIGDVIEVHYRDHGGEDTKVMPCLGRGIDCLADLA